MKRRFLISQLIAIPPFSGRKSTCNTADFDTKIVLSYSEPFRGIITCNDDAMGCDLTSKTDPVLLRANETYYVMIGGYDEWEVGTGVLTIGQATQAPTAAPTVRWTVRESLGCPHRPYPCPFLELDPAPRFHVPDRHPALHGRQQLQVAEFVCVCA